MDDIKTEMGECDRCESRDVPLALMPYDLGPGFAGYCKPCLAAAVGAIERDYEGGSNV